MVVERLKNFKKDETLENFIKANVDSDMIFLSEHEEVRYSEISKVVDACYYIDRKLHVSTSKDFLLVQKEDTEMNDFTVSVLTEKELDDMIRTLTF